MWTVNFGTSGRFSLEQVDGLSGIHIWRKNQVKIGIVTLNTADKFLQVPS